jgi:hypothetical protein
MTYWRVTLKKGNAIGTVFLYASTEQMLRMDLERSYLQYGYELCNIRPTKFDVLSGDLCDVSKPMPRVVRRQYKFQFSHIHNSRQLKATLRAGNRTSVGGYPLYFITKSGQAISFDGVWEELKQFLSATRKGYPRDWVIVGCDVNWEDPALYCDVTNERIPSAYAEEE